MPPRLLPANPAFRAGLFMVLAMASFVSNDTCMKFIGMKLSGPSLPVGEMMALRGLMSVALLTALGASRGVLGEAYLMASRPVAARAALDLVATVTFLLALMHMGIANLTAIMQAVPLAVTLLSALILGEKVGLRRSLAIAVGFAGVLLIVRPSPQSFTAYDGVAVVVVFAVAARDLMTRRIPPKVPGLIVALANAGFVTAGGFGLALFEGLLLPEAWQMALLALASLFLTSGYLLIVATLRIGELSASAPFRYSILIFAIVSGIAVFGEVPDQLAITGMMLIVAAGFVAASQEWRLRNTARMPVQ